MWDKVAVAVVVFFGDGNFKMSETAAEFSSQSVSISLEQVVVRC